MYATRRSQSSMGNQGSGIRNQGQRQKAATKRRTRRPTETPLLSRKVQASGVGVPALAGEIANRLKPALQQNTRVSTEYRPSVF